MSPFDMLYGSSLSSIMIKIDTKLQGIYKVVLVNKSNCRFTKCTSTFNRKGKIEDGSRNRKMDYIIFL